MSDILEPTPTASVTHAVRAHVRARQPLFETLSMLAICAFALAYYAQQQPRHTFAGGLAWDDVFYFHLAKQTCSDEALSGPLPFALRVGFPVAVCGVHKLTGLDLRNAALALGLMFALGSVLLLKRFLRSNGVSARTTLLFLVLYLMHSASPVRGSLFAPFNTGGVTHFFLLLGLLLVQRRVSWLWMSLYALLAVPVREVMLVFPMLFAVAGYLEPRQGAPRKPRVTDAAPLVLGALSFVGLRYGLVLIPNPDFLTNKPYSFLSHALATLYSQTFVRILFSACLAFGPMLWLLLYGFRQAWRVLAAKRVLLAYLALILGLAFVGGSDTERFIFWGFPVVFLLCAGVWESAVIPMASRVCTVGLMLLSSRAFWAIPYRVGSFGETCREQTPCRQYDPSPPPFLHFLTSNFQALDLHPYWGTPHFILLALAQHLTCIALLVFLQRASDRRHGVPKA